MKFVCAFFLGVSLMFFACAETSSEASDPPPAADSGVDASEGAADSGAELPSDGGADSEGTSDAHLLKTCQPIRGTNARGTTDLDLAGYLALAGDKYAGKGGFPGREVAYTFVPEQGGEVTFSLRSLDGRFDGALYVLSELASDAARIVPAVDGSGSYYLDYPLERCLLRERAVGAYFGAARAEHVTVRVEAGQTYYVVVDSAFPEDADEGIGLYEVAAFGAGCPCASLSAVQVCGDSEYGEVEVTDSCWRTSGSFDLFGNYSAEAISCGTCDQGRCDLLAHRCAGVPVIPVSQIGMPVEGDTRDGLSQFGDDSPLGNFSGQEKIHALTPERSGEITAILKSPDGNFDGALYRLSSIDGSAQLLQAADTFGMGYPESITFGAEAGKTYYVGVDSTARPGAYAIEFRDETLPCRAPDASALCAEFGDACGSVAAVDSCGRYALNSAGSLLLLPCAQCDGGMCDLARQQCSALEMPALVNCEETAATTDGGPALFTNETWLQYGLVYAAGPEAYFTYTAEASGWASVRLLAADFRWYISVYDNTNFSNLIAYADYYYSAADPSVRFQAEAGVTYYIVIDGETPADRGPIKVMAQAGSCAGAG